jgi:hypothetical protein
MALSLLFFWFTFVTGLLKRTLMGIFVSFVVCNF